MKTFSALVGAAILSLSFASSANAGPKPDVLVVKFRADDCANCGVMENQLASAMSMVNSTKVKQVTIDTSTPILWEKSAHEAFDHNVVPIFNKWVGLTGFAAVVDARSGKTIGCVNDSDDVSKMANLIKKTAGIAHMSPASTRATGFACPPAKNVDPGS